MERKIRQLYPSTCDDVMRHKMFFFPRAFFDSIGARYFIVEQTKGMMMLTLSHCLHQGFNVSPTVNVAVNMLSIKSIEHSLVASRVSAFLLTSHQKQSSRCSKKTWILTNLCHSSSPSLSYVLSPSLPCIHYECALIVFLFSSARSPLTLSSRPCLCSLSPCVLPPPLPPPCHAVVRTGVRDEE